MKRNGTKAKIESAGKTKNRRYTLDFRCFLRVKQKYIFGKNILYKSKRKYSRLKSVSELSRHARKEQSSESNGKSRHIKAESKIWMRGRKSKEK